MMRLFFLGLQLCSIVLLASCIQVNLPKNKIRDTQSYELPPPDSSEAFPCGVEIIPFLSESPAKFKMLYRKGNALRKDEYGKWVQTPPLMVTRYFRASFPNDSGNEFLILRGKILTFEADEHAKNVNLIIAYSISKDGDSDPIMNFVLRTSAPMKDLSADAYADAMRQALAEQVRKAKQKLREKFFPGK